MNKECETCIKRKTVYCPTSIECMATDDKPYYQNRIMLLEENKELKKQLEERPKEYVFIGNAQNKTRDFINQITKDNKEYKNQQKKFIEYLENEKYRLAGSVSHTYEDSLGKTRLVNEDIFNELDKILSKYKEIIGGKYE